MAAVPEMKWKRKTKKKIFHNDKDRKRKKKITNVIKKQREGSKYISIKEGSGRKK